MIWIRHNLSMHADHQKYQAFCIRKSPATSVSQSCRCSKIRNAKEMRMIVYDSMKENEVTAVYDLVVRVFHEHVSPVYTERGVDKFLGMISPAALLGANKGESSFIIVTRQNNRPIGMLVVREESHIALIFVDSQHQGKGIGKGLINEAIRMCQDRNPKLAAITVNSSPNSISFYKGIGFNPLGDEVDEDGLRYTPMEKIVD